MRAGFYAGVAAWGLAAAAAWGAAERAVDAASVVQARVDRETRGAGLDTSLHLEDIRRAEAEKRVNKIRNLSPERVQDWISGKLAEEDLDRVFSEPRAQEKGSDVAVPCARLNRLVLVSVATMAFAGLYGLQRRRERLGELEAEEEVPPRGERRVAPGQPRYGGDGRSSPLSGRQRALTAQQRTGGAGKGPALKGAHPPLPPRPKPTAGPGPAKPAPAARARGGKMRGGKARDGRFDLAQNWGDGMTGKRGGTAEPRKKK